MKEDRRIIWYKWKDPLGLNKKEEEILDEEEYKDDEYDDDDDKHGSYYDFEKMKKIVNNKVVLSNMGIIPVDVYNNPSRNFNYWEGHTNFKITNDDIALLNDVLGVEMLDVFTPYRFRVVIGMCFNSKDVKQSIYDALCGKPKRKVKVIKKDTSV